ncbi:MAG TPA: OsmC family protein [Bryobacteraceae bacterium]|nr:OsmC family protein [Bryobacteraceae bacterium]
MAGTFGGALEARQISASRDRLVAEAVGEIEKEDGVLIIRRIHVRLRLKAQEEHRATAERVHGFFADRCPVYRSLKDAIAISTELVFEPEQAV